MAKKKKKKVVVSKKKKGKAPTVTNKDTSLFTIPSNLADQARDIWMAGLGALSAVEEEGAKLFNQLVKRGEAWERTGRKQLQTASDNARKQADATAEAASATFREVSAASAKFIDELEDRIEQAVEPVLERMGVPGKKDLAALTAQIEALAEKLDRIQHDERTTPETKGRKSAEAVMKATEKAAQADPVAAVYAVEKHADGWAVMKEGNERATSVHGTKAEAVKEAREIARTHAPSMLVILKADGSEQERNTYEVE